LQASDQNIDERIRKLEEEIWKLAAQKREKDHS
jgi:hypothetical protein